ncbi:MAG: EAL domain-containing protein [Gemmatimonadaceae bacterium]|nr:EAL domain-containing protein [Gemmatimonadaceae bacterium]
MLLIDDDPSIHALVGAMLKPMHTRMSSATSGEDGLAQLRLQTPDLILLDNEMPGANGLEVLHWLRADPVLRVIPVIMETGSESNKTLSACFAAGAVDYIRKPFTAAELRARVGSVLERQRMLGELTSAARLDKLTGLANRTLLMDRLTVALAHARVDPAYGFTLMFLDFDRFKLTNDSLGHDVGDMLLQSIATRLQRNLRSTQSTAREAPGNTVARLGGDEFVVVLDDVFEPDIRNAIADRLLNALAAPYQLGTHTVQSSASIGVVCSRDGYETPEDMLRDADIAMYEAKARGKACHVSFTTGMRDAVRDRIETENELRDAIGTSQFFFMHQPIVSLDDRTIAGVEALARWQHPVRGAISPAAFIPIAEETGLIVPLSEQLLREACAAFMQWQRTAGVNAPSIISVNLSQSQFSDARLVERTLQVVQDAGMRPSQLQLEVKESQIMQQRSSALVLLAELRSHGIKLAMDNFGAGYSSLSCLQEFPLDVLKVDRSFVANACRGRDYAALLHAVVTLADNLGLRVVAEGIETEEQLVLLQALGCAYGQGFLLAEPMSAADVGALLSSHGGISAGHR